MIGLERDFNSIEYKESGPKKNKYYINMTDKRHFNSVSMKMPLELIKMMNIVNC